MIRRVESVSNASRAMSYMSRVLRKYSYGTSGSAGIFVSVFGSRVRMSSLEAASGVLSPVRQRLDRDKECPCRGPSGEGVARGVKQDLEALPGLESGATSGRKAQEPRFMDFVLGAQHLDAIVQGVDLGGQRMPAGCPGAPKIMGLANLSRRNTKCEGGSSVKQGGG